MKRYGYVMLKCFKIEMDERFVPELVCNKFLSWLFITFFAPFWNGRICIYEDEEES